MLSVRPRRTRPSLDLGLGLGMLVCALAAVPLGLDRIAAAPVVAAGLTLGKGGGVADGTGADAAGAPPLVLLLLRLFACLPLGDLAARANLAAVACAVAAAVLLGRLGFRILRSCESLEPAAEPPSGPSWQPTAAGLALVASEAPGAAGTTEGEGWSEPGWFAAAGPGEPWPWPTIRPQLRVVPGPPPGRAPAGPRHPSTSVSAVAAGPAPVAMMSAAGSRASRLHSLRTSAPGAVPPVAHEIFAVVGGVACGLGSLGTFLALTSAPAAALTLVIVLACWLQLLAFDRRPGTPRRGLVLALLAGLAIGVEPVAALLVWPAAALTCLRLLRQGERWPVLAPGAFAVGAAVALPWVGAGAFGAGPVAASWSAVRALGAAATSHAGLAQLRAVGRELLAQWGVVATLIALVGAAVLLVRRPRWFGFGLLSAVAALALVTSEATSGRAPGPLPGSAAQVVLSALICVPVILGMIRLAATLGPARGAGALGLAVLAALWPLLDGGPVRFGRAPGFPEALLERAHRGLDPGVVVDPGSREMTHLFRYGQALGLRPDLEIAPGQLAKVAAAPLARARGD